MEKLKLSLFDGDEPSTNTVSRVTEVSLLSAAETLRSYMCSPFIFKDNVRRAENFLSTQFLIFDFDDHALPIETLNARMEDWPYNYSVLTTKSHTDNCHHLRLVIPLSEEIKSPAVYTHTWKVMAKQFPECDSACRDLARLYFRSVKVVCNKTDREFLKPIMPTPEEEKKLLSPVSLVPPVARGTKGVPHPLTLKFIKEGAPDGEWHDAYVNAALNLKQNGYSYDEAETELKKATGQLDETDYKQLKDIYENRPVRPPYVPKNQQPLISDAFWDDDEQQLEIISADEKIRAYANANRAPFLCDAFKNKHWLTTGLTTIGAVTGHGKSTTAGNLVSYFLKHSTKKVLFLSNEESTEDVFSRIACHEMNIDWQLYRNGILSPERQAVVKAQFPALSKRMRVIHNNNGWDMSDLASVRKVFMDIRAVDRGIGLVVLDYLQNIIRDSEQPEVSRYDALKLFGNFIKDHGTRCFIPTVVFLQLFADPTKKVSFADRIQGDKYFANHATANIEAIPDFEKKITTFKFHKSRFSQMAGQEIICNFVGGKFVGG